MIDLYANYKKYNISKELAEILKMNLRTPVIRGGE